MSWLSSFLHPGRGYDKAQDELSKYFQQAQQFQQPFINNAQGAYGGLSEAMKNLLDPSALYDKWSQNYSESDAAKQAEAMASQRGLDAASSMGLMGSSPAISAIQSGTAGIAAQDKQQYLQDLMDKYKTGIGLGENIYGTGANAASQAAQNAMNMGQNSANMAFGKENAGGDLLSKLLGLGIGAFGGPIGQAAGAGFAQKMGWSPAGSYIPWSTGGA